MNRLLAIVSILLIFLITLNLWLISKEDVSVILNDPLLSLSQLLSLLSIALISISLLMTTRVRIIENIFQGLDKVYHLHRIFGAVGFVFLLNHPLLLTAKVAAAPTVGLMYLVPGNNLSLNMGIFSLYLFLLAFIFLVFIRLPYHLWKWLHSILSIGFLFACFHIFTIESDISRSMLLRSWIFSLISLGLLSSFYTTVLYKRIGPKHKYCVDRIYRSLDVINIWLKPISRKLHFESGQFVFIKFINSALGKEMHPFSVSSANFEGRLRLSVKIIGDYTVNLPNLKEGDKAEVFGPYGSFGKAYKERKKEQCWIAGGVGVTPFLSMLRNEFKERLDKKITLFYCYRQVEEGDFINEISYLIENLDNVRFIDWCSKEKGRLDVKKIKEEIGDIQNTEFLFCGPHTMMEHLKKNLVKIGVPEKNIIYEKFQWHEDI